MAQPTEIRTGRLVLRSWQSEDREPFAALNADPRVMECFARPLSREESDSMVDRMQARLDEDGYGLWAVEVVEAAPFIGFIGLSKPRLEAHFTPCVEVGWRLAFESWGHGYATEGARAALAFGFDMVGLDEIVSFATAGNVRSRAVMERIGMVRDPGDDFDHPSLPEGSPLRRHVLYRKASARMREPNGCPLSSK